MAEKKNVFTWEEEEEEEVMSFDFYFLHRDNLPGNHSLCLSK